MEVDTSLVSFNELPSVSLFESDLDLLVACVGSSELNIFLD
jgi:hypothetical protein